MANNDIDKTYVSPYDRFLFEFDATHEKSASQLKEIKKYKRIFALRDTPIATQAIDPLLG
ncbi:MAG TPA: hypothetical protein DDY37_00300 [Legionella sp.]|nr:hypothetical protein [Legionella sp.]